jgi:hypothetical protein
LDGAVDPGWAHLVSALLSGEATVRTPDDLLDDWSRQVAQKTSAQADAHQARDLLSRLHRLVQHYGVLAPGNELLPLLDEVRAFLISEDGVVSGEAATSSSASVEQAP